jgi:ParB/RepB/Spo0J family partition protein
MPSDKSEIKLIPIVLIAFPPTLLRLINKKSLEYIELKDSIQSVGLLNSICIRETKTKYRTHTFDIVDGVHRFVICQDLGWSKIPCIVIKNVTNEELPWLQMQANAHKKETDHAEYANFIRKLLLEKPEMELDEICSRLNKNPPWVKKVMTLLNLCDEAKQALSFRKIPTLTAYSLARLPKGIQKRIFPWALSMHSNKFAEMCGGIIRGYKEAKARDSLERFLKESLSAPKYLRSFKQLCLEYSINSVGELLIKKHRIKDPMDAWRMALAWVLHVDPASENNFKTKMLKKQHAFNQALLTRELDKKREIEAIKLQMEGDIKEILT